MSSNNLPENQSGLGDFVEEANTNPTADETNPVDDFLPEPDTNRVERHRRDADLPHESVALLKHLELVLKGHTHTTPTGEYYDLTMSMSSFYDGVEQYSDPLERAGLIERINGPHHRIYYRLTKAGGRTLNLRWIGDLNEGFTHICGSGLAATALQLNGYVTIADYPRVSVISEGYADSFAVAPSDARGLTPLEKAKARRTDPGPSMFVEVKTDTNDTGQTLNSWEKYAEADRKGVPTMWVFENLVAARRHINRVSRYNGRDVDSLPTKYDPERDAPTQRFEGANIKEIKRGVNLNVIKDYVSRERCGQSDDEHERLGFGIGRVETFESLTRLIRTVPVVERREQLPVLGWVDIVEQTDLLDGVLGFELDLPCIDE